MSEAHTHAESASEGGRLNLQADCERCFALCCVAPTFSVSADFPITKNAGQACPHLQPDFRCGIHTRLRQQGFRGCAVYDCFGAGQKVSQVTFAGRDWRQAPRTAKQMFEVFAIMRTLHELLWYLTEALRLPSAHPLHAELSLAHSQTERLTHQSPDALLQLDVTAHQRDVNVLPLRASELVRTEVRHKKKDLKGADLIGADFRGADLIGADLTGSLFLIQSQLDAAKGDSDTKLPPSLTRPKHW